MKSDKEREKKRKDEKKCSSRSRSSRWKDGQRLEEEEGRRWKIEVVYKHVR